MAVGSSTESGGLDDDHFFVGHVVHRGADAAESQPRRFSAAEGHPVHSEGAVLVDHDRRRIQPPSAIEGDVTTADDNNPFSNFGAAIYIYSL